MNRHLHYQRTSAFGVQLMSAVRQAEYDSLHRTEGPVEFYLFSGRPASIHRIHICVRLARTGLKDAYPEFNEVSAAIDQARSVLVAVEHGTIHVLGSGTEREFDQLHDQPWKVQKILDSFKEWAPAGYMSTANA